MYKNTNVVNNNIYYVGSSNSGGGSVNPNTPQNTGVFAQDYPNAAANLNQVISSEASGQSYDVTQRSLLEDEIDDMQDSNVVGSLQHQIDQLSGTLATNHYHDVAAHSHDLGAHTHSYNAASQAVGLNTTSSQPGVAVANSAQQTSGPGGSTAVGHSHVPGDIPHTHEVGHNHMIDVINHSGGTASQYGVNPLYSGYPQYSQQSGGAQ